MTTVALGDLKKEKQVTNDASLTVKVQANNPLEIGAHSFQLIVVDDSGNESVPATITVVVKDTQRPTAVLLLTDAEGNAVPNNTLEFGASFILAGQKSIDAPPGKITKYVWTMLS